MSISTPFIERPVATTLLTVALGISGAVAYRYLPVGPLPQVDFPSISISTSLPGASPETMASSVATPLERQFGRIAGINEMTSTSTLGSTNITLQFDLSRNIDAAARDVQASINAARGQLPANLPTESILAKGQSRRLPDSPDRPHFSDHDAGANVRRGFDDSATEAVAGPRRWASQRRGKRASGRPRGSESFPAESLRTGVGRRAGNAWESQRQFAKGSAFRRSAFLDPAHRRSNSEGSRLRAAWWWLIEMALP